MPEGNLFRHRRLGVRQCGRFAHFADMLVERFAHLGQGGIRCRIAQTIGNGPGFDRLVLGGIFNLAFLVRDRCRVGRQHDLRVVPEGCRAWRFGFLASNRRGEADPAVGTDRHLFRDALDQKLRRATGEHQVGLY